MKKIENYMLPEHTNTLYKQEAASSIHLSKEVADKLNEVINYLNEIEKRDLEWKQTQEGTIRKGVIFMKDNLINSINEFFNLLEEQGVIDNRIAEYCSHLKQRLDNVIGMLKEGSTTMDAEIIDARVDNFGVTNKTVGTGVRNSLDIVFDRLDDTYLDSIDFYKAFSNISYSGEAAYNRLGNADFFTLNKDIVAIAPVGYDVSTTVWVDGSKVSDSGWTKKVIIPKTFQARFGLRKSNNTAINTTDLHRITFEEDNVELEDLDISNLLEYTSGGYFANNRLSAKYFSVSSPIAITCPVGYLVAVKMYKIANGVREFQKDTGWVESVILQTGLEFEINFRKESDEPIFKSELAKYSITTINLTGSTNKNVKAICHRGYNIEAPENTLSAYKAAKKNGFTYVECDVSFTSDGIPVLLHDDTIDRTSNGSGTIKNLTFEKVRTYDFGSWFSEKYTGELIPSFEEFIKLCRNYGLHPYIEIKYGATREQVQALINIVKRAGMKGKVTYISFESSILSFVHEIDEHARIGFVTNVFTETTLNNIKTLIGENELFIDLNIENVTEDVVALCIDNDLSLEVWTVNNNNRIKNTDCYVSGFTTDYVNTDILLREV